LPAWFGVNRYDLPTWVSCDDAGRWCAAEQDPNMLVLNKNGIRETGRAPLAPPDPVAALVKAGMPVESARQVIN